MIDIFHTEKRFGPDLYKTKVPYNCLTLLDVRYGELYFDETQKEKAISDINSDAIFAHLGMSSSENNVVANSNSSATSENKEMSVIERRRAKLLEAVSNSSSDQVNLTSRSINDQILDEINKLHSFTQHVSAKLDILKWCRENCAKFPLISKYWLSYMAFPATSCSAERTFNVDGLILSDRRKRLDPDTTQKLIICHDYWMSREPAEMFKLCPKCPQPPSNNACYQICFDKHCKKV